MKEEILSIASDLREGSMTLKEAQAQLLRLLSVVGRSEQLKCTHQWRDGGGYFRCCKCGEYGNATT